jgi:hypothetical protein
MDRKIEQPATEVWRGEDGMICIGQDEPYTDEPNVVVIHPLFLPQVITWLKELLTEEPAKDTREA